MSRGFRENFNRLTTSSKKQAKFDLDRARREAMQPGKPSDKPITPHLDQTTLLEKGKNRFLTEKTVQNKAAKKEIENKAIRSFIESSTLLKIAYICANKFTLWKKSFTSSKDTLTISKLGDMLKGVDTILAQTEDRQVLEGKLSEIGTKTKDSITNAAEQMQEAGKKKSLGSYSESLRNYMLSLSENKNDVKGFSDSLVNSQLNKEEGRDFREQILNFSEEVSDFMKKKVYDSFFQSHLSNTYDLTKGWPDYSLSIEQVKSQYGEDMVKAAKDAKDISNDLVSEITAPEIVSKKSDYDTNLKKIIDGTSEGQKLLIVSDFDGTGADFTKYAKDTRARAAYRRAIETLVEQGHDVAVVTGRPIEGEDGVRAALQNSGFSEETIAKLHIYGSHGAERRTPNTKGEVEVPADIQSVLETQGTLVNAITSAIKKNTELNNLITKEEIKVEIKRARGFVSGATFHFRNIVGEQKRLAVEQQLKDITNQQINADSKKYGDFTIKDGARSFELRIKDTAPVQINKGAATETLIKDLNPTNLIGLGDDTTDIDIQAAGKKGIKEKKLGNQIFIGVQHVDGSKTPEKILNDSDIVMKGPKNTAKLLLAIAKKLSSRKTGDSSVSSATAEYDQGD